MRNAMFLLRFVLHGGGLAALIPAGQANTARLAQSTSYTIIVWRLIIRSKHFHN
jgi:hypothetical protein